MLETGSRTSYNHQFDQAMKGEVLFTRARSVAEVIEGLLQNTANSVEAALYRLSLPGLVQGLVAAASRGVKVRVVLDQGKFEETRATRELLAAANFSFRLRRGRRGIGSKMHHKFVILDTCTVLTGSYNWTHESQEENFENLVILRDPQLAQDYAREFEALWEEGQGLGIGD